MPHVLGGLLTLYGLGRAPVSLDSMVAGSSPLSVCDTRASGAGFAGECLLSPGMINLLIRERAEISGVHGIVIIRTRL